MTTTNANTASRPVVFTREAIASIPMVPLGPMEGVLHKELWRSKSSTSGVLMIEEGHHLGAHTHRFNHHHMWVMQGHAAILGAHLGPGSYVHIPPGVEHDIDATGTEGCTLFYVYERPE
jgi:quercetin dioxygenase-like cupin family protein